MVIAAVIGNPYAVVLMVHKDALRVPVSEAADVDGSNQLCDGTIEDEDHIFF